MARWCLVALVAACGGGHAAVDAPPLSDGAMRTDASSTARCPLEMTLVADRTTCAPSTVAPPAALATSTAQPGDLVSIAGVDEPALPCLPLLVCRPLESATMLFSDDPESPSADGVLYADTVGPATVRVYVYHANGGTSPRKFPVVVLNQGTTEAHVTIVRAGRAAPSTDYLAVGKAVVVAWFTPLQPAPTVTVPAGARVLLDDQLDAAHAGHAELVHAIYDLEVDAPVKISVVSVLADADAAATTAGLSLLPNDGAHDRGTFVGADLTLLAPHLGGEGPSLRRAALGDGSTEPDLAGTDATTGAAATLHGNYGVTYKLLATVPDSVRIAGSARGGDWVGALSTLALPDTTALPAHTAVLAPGTDAVWLATRTGHAALDVTLMTGGSSSLPLDVLVATP